MTQLLDVVTAKLKSIYDKTAGQNILDLGFIDGCHVDAAGHVKIALKAPLGQDEAFAALRQHIQTTLGVLPGITQVTVFFVRTQPSAPAPRLALPDVARVVVVGAGKGGVGKSTVAVNLGCALAQEGHRVGVLDADIYGPSVAMMLGGQKKPAQAPAAPGKIMPLSGYGVRYLSIDHLLPDQDAVIWRGPMVQKAFLQMLTQTHWGVLDYLIIDLPPGTGDIPLTLSQKLPITGAVLVTTPQDVALADVRKAAEMFAKTGIPILGLVENMSIFTCPHCQETTDIFHTGGGESLAQELGVALLGRLALDARVRISGDTGVPVVQQDDVIAQTYRRMAQDLHARLARQIPLKN